MLRTMRPILSIILWLVMLAPAMAGPQARKTATLTARRPPANPAHRLLATPTTLDQIGRVVAPVMVDGRGPFRFVVDTGANHSMISRHLARRLGLLPVKHGDDDIRVMGITGAEQLPWVRVARLQVGDLAMSNLRLPVTHSPVMAGADGILGAAGLRGDRISVDFEHNEVWIGRSHGGRVWGFLHIPAQRTPGGLLVIAARIGRVPVEAVIDTGSPRTLGNEALRRALLAKFSKGSPRPKIYGVTRQVSSGNLATSPTIKLGQVKIRHLSIVYSDIPIFKVWHLERRPAIILGMDVLGTVDTLVLDFAYPNVYVLPVHPQGIEVTETSGVS